ncbi:MAG: aminopeptidase [Chloroflexota bacterium]|nr:aminopeptidase [Chloroflexota bacterium]
MTDAQTFAAQLERYADVLLSLGVNLQPGQNLVINMAAAPVEEIAPLARIITRRAYEMGARNVFPEWNDAAMARTRMLLAPEEALSDVEMWRIHWIEEEAERGSALLTLFGSDPDLMSGVDPARLTTSRLANARAGTKISQMLSKLAAPWSVGAVATAAWARKVHPDLSEADALAALWRYIFATTRVDQPDPIQAWNQHLDQLSAHMTYLNGMRFRRLRYSAPGTDLALDLPEGHLWVGGGAGDHNGARFVPNLPTEEVFSAPARGGVNGTVASTMPLSYNGSLIEGIRLTLEDGRIVKWSADRGEALLTSIIETDEGSHYLGEVALVPHNSPVNVGSPVFNTLFDENASCHIAIGRAYPICLEGGEALSPDELVARGLNVSDAHVDFMIGSAEMDIEGETASGERVPLFRHGLWAYDAAR